MHKNLVLSIELVRNILNKEPYFQNIIQDDLIVSWFLQDSWDRQMREKLLEYLYQITLSPSTKKTPIKKDSQKPKIIYGQDRWPNFGKGYLSH